MNQVEFEEKFEKLKFLFSKGILSEEEFEDKKESLINLFVNGHHDSLKKTLSDQKMKQKTKGKSRNSTSKDQLRALSRPLSAPSLTTNTTATNNLQSPSLEHQQQQTQQRLKSNQQHDNNVIQDQKTRAYSALFPHIPGQKDELQLLPGDIIEVDTIYDDNVAQSEVSELNATLLHNLCEYSQTQLSQMEALTSMSEAAWEGDLYLTKQFAKNLTPELINLFRNSRGQSILYCACRQGHYYVVRYLLSLGGIEVNGVSGGHGSGLHAACFGGWPSIVALLLNNMASPDITNSFGNTPFDECSALVNDVVRAYKEKGTVGIISYLTPWSGRVSCTFQSAHNWVAGPESKKIIYEILSRFYSHEGVLLASFTHKICTKCTSPLIEKSFDILLGHLSLYQITLKIEISYAGSKHEGLRKWAIGELSFDVSTTASKNATIPLRPIIVCTYSLLPYLPTPLSPRRSMIIEKSDYKLSLTLSFHEVDEQEMKDQLIRVLEEKGIKLFHFNKFYDMMQQSIKNHQNPSAAKEIAQSNRLEIEFKNDKNDKLVKKNSFNSKSKVNLSLSKSRIKNVTKFGTSSHIIHPSIPSSLSPIKLSSEELTLSHHKCHSKIQQDLIQ